MGTTGLETAFAALYTELVASGELELETVVERMSDGGALYDLLTPRIAVGEPANLCLVDLETRWEVGAGATPAARPTAAFTAAPFRAALS